MQRLAPLLIAVFVVASPGAEPAPVKTGSEKSPTVWGKTLEQRTVLAKDKAPLKTPPGKELTFEGKTLEQWMALATAKEPAVRIEAAQALAELGPAAIPALTELLRDREPDALEAARAQLKLYEQKKPFQED